MSTHHLSRPWKKEEHPECVPFPGGLTFPTFYISLSLILPFIFFFLLLLRAGHSNDIGEKGANSIRGKGSEGCFTRRKRKEKGLFLSLVHRSESGFAKCPQSPGLQRYSRSVLGEM